MELKRFADLIDALGNLTGRLKAIVNLPNTKREKYRQTLNETYRLIETTLNMVVIQLGDMLLVSRLGHIGHVDLKSLRRTRWIITMKIIQPPTKLKF